MKKNHPFLCMVIICLSACQSEVGFVPSGPMNIILIMADDMGIETIGAYGGESYATPNLDRLAATGSRFDHCYSQPLCTPSRVKIMTGKYNVRNYHRFGRLPRRDTTFAQVLKEAGYATCIAGKWQLGNERDSPSHFGFDESLLWQHTDLGRIRRGGITYDKRYENPILQRNAEKETYDNGEYAPDLMVDFIKDFMDRHTDRPFLVYYPMILPHSPFVPTPDSPDWDPESPGSTTYRGDPQYFGDMVEYIDKLVGDIEAHVHDLGLTDNTIIIFTGDNGTDKPITSIFQGRSVQGGKNTPTDAGTRVPLIVKGPGIRMQVINDLIDFSDFFPTLCDFAQIEISEDQLILDGYSFAPRLRGQRDAAREYVYCWFNKDGYDSLATVYARNRKYKLYRSGEFYDIENDDLEEFDLSRRSLSPDELQTKELLLDIILRNQALRSD